MTSNQGRSQDFFRGGAKCQVFPSEDSIHHNLEKNCINYTYLFINLLCINKLIKPTIVCIISLRAVHNYDVLMTGT